MRARSVSKHAAFFFGIVCAAFLALGASDALAQGHEPTTEHSQPGEQGKPAAHGTPGEHGAPGDHAAAAGEHGEHAGGHHGPEPINWSDIFDKKRPAFVALLINFGALAALYYILGKKPITEALKQRRVTIGKDIDEAQKLLSEAKERAKKYQADLKNADADAATAKASLVSAGKGEVEHLLAEANERADRMKRDADRLVDQERKQVQLDLLKETVDLAVKEASQMLEKGVNADDHMRLANDLLAELAKRPSAPRAASVVPPRGGSAVPPPAGPVGGAS